MVVRVVLISQISKTGLFEDVIKDALCKCSPTKRQNLQHLQCPLDDLFHLGIGGLGKQFDHHLLGGSGTES